MTRPFGGARAEHDVALLMAAAREAATHIRTSAASLSSLTWENKAPADFVTDVDRECERRITQLLRAEFPGAAIIGEEFSPGAAAGSGVAFVVDPLDGTTNFLHGYPWYAVSIAALIDGELAAGVVHNAASGEIFHAVAGQGAFRGGAPIHVSAITDPARSLIGTGFPFKNLDRLDEYSAQFAAITRQTAGLRRAGSAALDLCDVACGRFEGFWELQLAPWDFAAGALIIREAGGIITDGSGNGPAIAQSSIVAGTPAVHRWLMQILNSTAP